MWTYPMWGLWADAPPPLHQPSTVERILARTRHPSFTPSVAEQLVRDLSRRDSRRLWTETGRLLEGALEDDLRLRLVVLRERLLHRLDPVAELRSGRDVGRRRGDRS